MLPQPDHFMLGQPLYAMSPDLPEKERQLDGQAASGRRLALGAPSLKVIWRTFISFAPSTKGTKTKRKPTTRESSTISSDSKWSVRNGAGIESSSSIGSSPSAMCRPMCKAGQAGCVSLLVSILLPLLLVLLLPSLKLEPVHKLSHSSAHLGQRSLSPEPVAPERGEPEWASGSGLVRFLFGLSALKEKRRSSTMEWEVKRGEMGKTRTFEMLANELLLNIARFPFDRLRLVSGSLVQGATAKEIASKHDLLEEETHLLMAAPAEHRTSYLAPQSPTAGIYHQSGSSIRPHRVELYAPAPQSSGEQMIGGGGGGQQHQADLHSGGAAMSSEYSGPPSDATGGASGSVEAGGGTQAGPDGTALSGAEQQTGTLGGSGSATGGPSTGLQARGDLPAVKALNVKCEKNHMTVNINFDRPFYGMVFSKGHYNDQKCVHLPANSGQTTVNFDIHLGKCGMTSSDGSMPGSGGAGQYGNSNSGLQHANQQLQQQPNGLFIENIIIIQYDPQVQEIYDQARKLRCTWYDYYEKSVTFRPYNVDMLDAVTANFLGDNIQCWMQIQVGKGPWSSEVAGIVKIGQTMTMVLAIKDDENRFDMLVRNCVAHDGKHQPIQLVDEYGCVARPKIMSRFNKVRNFGPAATVVSYAHFQAFKFPDSMSVHFQCVIQVCRHECPEPVCSGSQAGGESSSGAIGSSSPGGSATDYAASGTELVASKEAMPGSTVNLKLDEAQGRVQVKLDTSMMAGLGQAARAGNQAGPLPPHLLHSNQAATQAGAAQVAVASASGDPPTSVHSRPHTSGLAGSSFTHPGGRGGSGAGGHTSAAGFLSSSYFRPPGGATSGQHGGRPLGLSRAPATPSSGHQQHVHYSAPFPQPSIYRTAFATNRIGELPSSPDGHGERTHLLATDHIQSLSLLGSPRALRLAPTIPANLSSLSLPSAAMAVPLRIGPAPNHRYRRSVSAAAGGHPNRPKRDEDPNQADSTAVRTQKTIQVVSPDDVAFSLLGTADELESYATNTPGTNTRSNSRKQQSLGTDYSPSSAVCFSATKLMAGILVIVALLAASVALVATMLLSQRRY